MNNWVKKTVPFAVAASIAFTIVPNAALAKERKHEDEQKQEQKSEHKNKWELKDIKSHWAQQTIQKMSLLGVINGYNDFTFKPNKPVTHAEAVVMTIRLLGLEEAAKAKETMNLSFKDEASIPGWAKGSIALAIEKGLIADGDVFQANKAASRLYVTMLLVNTIGTEFNGNWEAAKTYFKDVNNLDDKEKAYLAYAALNQLVNGYDDETFKPNKPVTRAEMAALVNRVLDKKENLNENVYGDVSGKGKISAIVGNVVTVNSKKNISRAYTIDPQADIYIDDKKAVASELSANMKIEFIVGNDGEIDYISAKATDDDEENKLTYTGTVTKVTGSTVWVQVGLVNFPFTLGENIALTSFQEGKTVSFNVDETGAISTVQTEKTSPFSDLQKLEVTVTGDQDHKTEISIEVDHNELDASVEIQGESKVELEGERAVVYLTNLFAAEGIQFTEQAFDLTKLQTALENKLNVTSGQLAGEVVINGQTYNFTKQNDQETTQLLNKLGDLEQLNLRIKGDQNSETALKLEVNQDQTFTAEVMIKNNGMDFKASGKTALTYIVNLFEQEGIEFKGNVIEINELASDVVTKFAIKNADVQGEVIVNGTTYQVNQ